MPAPGTATNVLTKPRVESLVGVISTKVQRSPSQPAEVAGKLYFHHPSLCSSTGAPKKEGSFSSACSHSGDIPISSTYMDKKIASISFLLEKFVFQFSLPY